MAVRSGAAACEDSRRGRKSRLKGGCGQNWPPHSHARVFCNSVILERKAVTHSNDSMTRRGLLGQALGVAALASAFNSAGQLIAQTPEAARIRDSFDFGWKFFKGDAPGAQQPGFAAANWRSLDLPHDWSIEGPFSQNESSGGSGGYAPTGIGWYRKGFRLPASYRDRKVSIEFDGVY